MARNKHRAKAFAAIRSRLPDFASSLEAAGTMENADFGDADDDTDHDVEEVDSDSTESGDDEIDSISQGRMAHISSPNLQVNH